MTIQAVSNEEPELVAVGVEVAPVVVVRVGVDVIVRVDVAVNGVPVEVATGVEVVGIDVRVGVVVATEVAAAPPMVVERNAIGIKS